MIYPHLRNQCKLTKNGVPLFFLLISITPLVALAQNNPIVAIIDTGADLEHHSLKDSIWENPGEVGLDSMGRSKKTNGIDDDQNGFVDDVSGWNFVNNNNNISDKNGHGTHISGIIIKESLKINHEQPELLKPKLMILKYFDPKLTGAEHLKSTVRAIEYARKMGANIINYSAGGPESHLLEKKAIEKCLKQKILFVAAAGNENLNSDHLKFYPAGYELPNILSVGSIDSMGQKLKTSNFGAKSVDLFAKGLNIRSALPKGRTGKMSGTSQATAFVTATAAMLWSQFHGEIHPIQLKERILKTTKVKSLLKEKSSSGGQLDSLFSLQSRDSNQGFDDRPLVYHPNWDQLLPQSAGLFIHSN